MLVRAGGSGDDPAVRGCPVLAVPSRARRAGRRGPTRVDSPRAGAQFRTPADRRDPAGLLDRGRPARPAVVPAGRTARRRRRPDDDHPGRPSPRPPWSGRRSRAATGPTPRSSASASRRCCASSRPSAASSASCVAQGSQTLLPSLEAAYPWLLALLATSLFAGIGLARRIQGGNALRRQATHPVGRLRARADARRRDPVLERRPSPTNSPCATRSARRVALRPDAGRRANRRPATGRCRSDRSARLTSRLYATVDLRPAGSVELSGTRDGTRLPLDRLRRDARRARAGRRRADRAGCLVRAAGRSLGQPSTRDRRVPGLGRRPDPADGPDDGRPGDLRGPRRRGHRGRPGTALPDRGRRRHVRGRVPADPLARRRRGPAPLARPARLLGLPRRPARSGRPAAPAARRSGMDPDALLATVEVRMTATSRDDDLVIYPPSP